MNYDADSHQRGSWIARKYLVVAGRFPKGGESRSTDKMSSVQSILSCSPISSESLQTMKSLRA